jgi:hypothetical protein
MRVKFVISALILLAVVVCLPRENQAYVGPPYFDPDGYAGEHPWQHDGSPGPGDSLNHLTARIKAHIVVFPVGINTMAIQLIREANCDTRSSDRPHRVESDHVRRLQFRNER